MKLLKMLPGTRNRRISENPRARCFNCGHVFHWSAGANDNPIYYNETPGDIGRYVCPDCYNNDFGYCVECGKLRRYTDMNDNGVCPACLILNASREYYAVTRWSLEDVLTYRPEWTEAQAREWWTQHERAFAEMLTAEGMERLAAMLDETAPAEEVEV